MPPEQQTGAQPLGGDEKRSRLPPVSIPTSSTLQPALQGRALSNSSTSSQAGLLAACPRPTPQAVSATSMPPRPRRAPAGIPDRLFGEQSQAMSSSSSSSPMPPTPPEGASSSSSSSSKAPEISQDADDDQPLAEANSTAAAKKAILNKRKRLNHKRNKAAEKEAATRQPPCPPLEETPLGTIKAASDNIAADRDYVSDRSAFDKMMNEMAPMPTTVDCTFCKFDANVGISNEKAWLPNTATWGYCEPCEQSCNTFSTVWKDIVKSPTFQRPATMTKERHQELIDLPTPSPLSLDVLGPDPRPRPHKESKIDGRDITRFQGIHFCAGSPHRQINIRKVSICGACRDEKYTIMKHRHASFVAIEVFESAKSRRCMVCTGSATSVCKGCPLRLCVNCDVFLTSLCKGYLDNLFYHYDKEHLRNDAFLLRSDLDPKQLVFTRPLVARR